MFYNRSHFDVLFLFLLQFIKTSMEVNESLWRRDVFSIHNALQQEHVLFQLLFLFSCTGQGKSEGYGTERYVMKTSVLYIWCQFQGCVLTSVNFVWYKVALRDDYSPLALMTDAANIYQLTRHNDPQGSHLHTLRREHLDMFTHTDTYSLPRESEISPRWSLTPFFWVLINCRLAHCCRHVFRCKYSSEDSVARCSIRRSSRSMSVIDITMQCVAWTCSLFSNSPCVCQLPAAKGVSKVCSPAQRIWQNGEVNWLALDTSGTVGVEGRASFFGIHLGLHQV
jgi:hypothetical protein